MKIGLDVRMINASGIGTTIQGLLDHFSDSQLKHLTLFGTPHSAPFPPTAFIDARYPIYSLRQHWSFGALLNRQNLSLYHMPHFDVPYFYKGPLVATVHDLIHYLFPQYSSKPFSKLYSRVLLSHVAKTARKIIVVSENTKKDLIRHFPASDGKITVLYPAADSRFSPVDPETEKGVLSRHNLSKGYLLYVGNIRPSKNTKNLVEAYLSLRREIKNLPPLVLVGTVFYKDWKYEDGQDGIRMLGSVKMEELPALYSASSLFIFPSLYEGFGLPPLEAMSCGAPVLSSQEASLPEVCGDAAEYTAGPSSAQIAQKISLLLKSEERRKELRERGFVQAKKFSWDKFAQGTWRVYQEAMGNPS